jgi:hypothetical protein
MAMLIEQDYSDPEFASQRIQPVAQVDVRMIASSTVQKGSADAVLEA